MNISKKEDIPLVCMFSRSLLETPKRHFEVLHKHFSLLFLSLVWHIEELWSRDRIRRILPNLWTVQAGVHVLHKYTSMQARVKHMNSCKQMKTTTTTHGGIHPDIWSLISAALARDTSAPLAGWICTVSVVESDASCYGILASTVSVCASCCALEK